MVVTPFWHPDRKGDWRAFAKVRACMLLLGAGAGSGRGHWRF